MVSIYWMSLISSRPSNGFFTTFALYPAAATQLELYFQPNGDWSGTIYVDHVQLTH